MKAFAIVLGSILVIVGILMGIGKQTITVDGTTIGCGSAFTRSYGRDAESKDQFNHPVGTPSRYGEKCDNKLDSMHMLTTVLLVVGGAVAVAGLFIPSQRRRGAASD
ncbi:hypothetical protein A5745_12690 [Mycobacterium sp. IS-2888]|uniref:hypothetical protein n=1 Tax=Mycobacterium sp. IS-2888 TaxID=1834159 RepID=UPI00096C3327|nr:hypothetical protein [Mycobacterium sp. IS-2888]OMC46343.1 hypothetical protein A5745_12690 [Mycobacterium sp. IS-2888]